MNNAIIPYQQTNTGSSANKRIHEQESRLKDSSTTDSIQTPSDKHVLLETYNDFLLLSFTELDYKHFSKLAKLMDFVCDGLIKVTQTSIPAYCDKIIKIQQMLEVPIKVYNDQIEELIESVNKQVQLQYKELTDMLENLPLSQPLCIDGILKGMQFQECIGPYSPHNLVQAVKKINRSTTTQSRCTIM